MKDQVAADPNKYRHLLSHLSTADKTIYVECFGKTIHRSLGGHEAEAAYKAMLQKVAELKSGCKLVAVHVQPTSELMPLILMVRENIPAYKAIVADVVESCGLSSQQVVVSFRHETKAPYRIIEKSLTKGPNPDYPDCSKVLDVFGCLINCTDYVCMAAVVSAFAAKHKSGELQLTRVKDRWTSPSGGGWRDLMLNLVINGIVFEVQIVHSKMLAARKGLNAHKAYNQFRSFAEIFDLLDLDPTLSSAVGGDGGGGDDGVNVNLVQLNRQLRADFEAERAAHAAERAAHAATKQEVVRLTELLAGFGHGDGHPESSAGD